MPRKSWTIDTNTQELIGPCGCRVPGSAEGLKQAQEHECPKSDEEQPDG